MKYNILHIIFALFVINICTAQEINFESNYVSYDTLDFYTNQYMGQIIVDEVSELYTVTGNYCHRKNPDLERICGPMAYIIDFDGSIIDHRVYVFNSFSISWLDMSKLNDSYIGSGLSWLTNTGETIFQIELDLDYNLLGVDYLVGLNEDQYPNFQVEMRGAVESFNDGYLMVGYVKTGSYGDSYNTYLSKIIGDSIVWETVIGDPDFGDGAIDIQRNTVDETYIVLAHKREFDVPVINEKVYLMKIDDSGNILAQSEPLLVSTNVTELYPSEMAINENGQIIFVGRNDNFASLVLTDSEFEIIWENKFHVPGAENLSVNTNCVFAHDGNIVVAGTYRNDDPDNIQEFTSFITKYDIETGDSIWHKEMIHRDSIYDVEAHHKYLHDLKLTPDNGFIISGYVFYPSIEYPQIPYNQAGWVKKVDENGCTEWNCGLPVSIPSIKNELLPDFRFSNPINDKFEIYLQNNPLNDQFIFELTDINGIKRISGELFNGKMQIDTHLWPAGVYNCIIKNATDLSIVRTEKILKL